MNHVAWLGGVLPSGTSAGGQLRPSSVAAVVVLVSSAYVSVTSSADPVRNRDGSAVPVIGSTTAGEPQTTAPQAEQGNFSVDPMTRGVSILELRQLSGLTWEQLSRLVGVARRSLHFWASGKPMTPANEERLQRVLAVLRKADRGNVDENRRALLQASADGVMALDLLAAEKFGEAERLLGRGGGRRRPSRPFLSEAARSDRRPSPLVDRLDTRHEPIHRDVGRPRPARPARRGK